MKLQFEPTVDILRESVALLGHFCGRVPNQTLREAIRARSQFAVFTEEAEKELDIYQAFFDHIEHEIHLTDEERELLRVDVCKESDDEASSSVLFSISKIHGLTLDEAIRTVNATEEGILRGHFLASVFEDASILRGSSVPMTEFLRRILDLSDWTAEDRCHVVQIFVDYRANFNKAVPIIRRTMTVLENALPMIAPQLTEWTTQTEALIENGLDSQLVTKITRLVPQIEDYNLTMLIKPSIAEPASLRISIAGMEGEANDRLFTQAFQSSIEVGIATHKMGIKQFVARDQLTESELMLCLKMLSDRSKFDILVILRDEPSYAAQLATKLNLSPATISYHMNTLTANRLVVVAIEDKRLYYQLNIDTIKSIAESLLKIFLK